MTTADLWTLPRVGRPVATADGEVVVVPVTTHPGGTAVTRLWRRGQGGDWWPLTSDTATASAPALSPDGDRVAFVRSVDGRRQAHVLPLDGGEARVVTDLPLGVVGSVRWVGDDRLLVVTRLLDADPTTAATAAWRDTADERPDVLATERRLSRAWDAWYVDPLTEHVLLVDLTDPDAPARDCTPGTWLLPDPLADPAGHAAVSPDGSWLAFTSAHPDGEDDGTPIARLHVVRLDDDDPSVRCVTSDAPGPAGPPRWLSDGRLLTTVRTVRDWYAAPTVLWAIDPASGSYEVLVDEADDLLGELVVGPGDRIVFATELRGRGRLLELVDGRLVELPAPETGGLSQPAITASGIYAVHAATTSPPEVVRVTDDGVERLSDFTASTVAALDLGRLEERTVSGGDGDDVQVLVLHPPAAAVHDDGPPPLVHLIHGGPHGTFGDTWHWRWCAARFAAEGWVVAMVNFHGSTSFGHAFTASIEGDWSRLPAADVLAATDALVADGTVDADRMAIAGGSYGGFLTVWLTTQTNRFRTAVAHAAVTDVTGMWASDWTVGHDRAFGGRPWDDPEVVARNSPAAHFGSMRTPMLVLHGERDLRVPIDQGRLLYGALQTLRVESRLVVFPAENHWVLGRDTSERWYHEVLTWLHRHLDA